MFQISESLAYKKWKTRGGTRFSVVIPKCTFVHNMSPMKNLDTISDIVSQNICIFICEFFYGTNILFCTLMDCVISFANILCTKVHFGIAPLKRVTTFSPTFCKPNFLKLGT